MDGKAPGFAFSGGAGGAAGAAPVGAGLPFALPQHGELDQVFTKSAHTLPAPLLLFTLRLSNAASNNPWVNIISSCHYFNDVTKQFVPTTGSWLFPVSQAAQVQVCRLKAPLYHTHVSRVKGARARVP